MHSTYYPYKLTDRALCLIDDIRMIGQYSILPRLGGLAVTAGSVAVAGLGALGSLAYGGGAVGLLAGRALKDEFNGYYFPFTVGLVG